MNKFTFALALGTGLTVSLAAPSAQADAIVDLTTAEISAATFNSMFTAANTAVLSPFQFKGPEPRA